MWDAIQSAATFRRLFLQEGVRWWKAEGLDHLGLEGLVGQASAQGDELLGLGANHDGNVADLILDEGLDCPGDGLGRRAFIDRLGDDRPEMDGQAAFRRSPELIVFVWIISHKLNLEIRDEIDPVYHVDDCSPCCGLCPCTDYGGD